MKPDRAVIVERGDVLSLVAEHDLQRISFSPDLVRCREQNLPLWPSSRPDWALELSTDEQDLGFETATITEELLTAQPHVVGSLLAELTDRTVEWGLDPTIVSDFVTQLGHHL